MCVSKRTCVCQSVYVSISLSLSLSLSLSYLRNRDPSRPISLRKQQLIFRWRRATKAPPPPPPKKKKKKKPNQQQQSVPSLCARIPHIPIPWLGLPLLSAVQAPAPDSVLCLCVCLCGLRVCVCERERERERACVRAHARVCLFCVCVSVCVRARVCARECERQCVRERVCRCARPAGNRRFIEYLLADGSASVRLAALAWALGPCPQTQINHPPLNLTSQV